MSDTVRFLLGDEPQELRGFDPQLTVLEWLRSNLRRTGTKEGCAEGDCGACTVAVGEMCEGRIRYRAFNSCIQLLATLDGKQLLTVEDLQNPGDTPTGLHPVQQAMVDQHGSQCGFCTPGFVMSLFTLYHANGAIGRQAIDRALAGNLCRCTGYAPIVRAAEQALKTAPSDRFSQAEKRTAARLEQLRPKEMLRLDCKGRQFFAPSSLAQLWQLLQEHPDAVLVAGATDVGLWMTKQLRVFDTLVYTGRVQELLGVTIDEQAGELSIGAAVSYSDALEPLTDRFPGLRNMLMRLGADQVRNAGTIGGNIANGSPIGDMPPALIVLGARLVLSSAAGRRELPLEDFFIDYGKQDLQLGECVERVAIPLPQKASRFAVYKLSKRFDQDISAVCGAFRVSFEDQTVSQARICFGGMAGTPRRAPAAEQALLGREWNAQTIARARDALAGDYTPLSDWRASSDYRLLAAQNLLQRFYLETTRSEPVQLQAAGGAAP